MDEFTTEAGLILVAFVMGIGLTLLLWPRSPRTYFVVTAVPPVESDLAAGRGCGAGLAGLLLLALVVGLGMLLVQ